MLWRIVYTIGFFLRTMRRSRRNKITASMIVTTFSYKTIRAGCNAADGCFNDRVSSVQYSSVQFRLIPSQSVKDA